MPQPSFREINRARRFRQAFDTFVAFYRRQGLRGAAARSKARSVAARIHRPPSAAHLFR
jgi:hypothetical protein